MAGFLNYLSFLISAFIWPWLLIKYARVQLDEIIK